VDLEAAIRTGLNEGQFVLHYQPIVDVVSRDTASYEALVRWDRPGHGLVQPDEFIPTAELSNLICDLGRWVLHEATGQLAEWNRAHAGSLTVAVNISGRHLATAGIVADVARALETAHLPADRLVLEITETVLVDQPMALAHLGALQELGVRDQHRRLRHRVHLHRPTAEPLRRHPRDRSEPGRVLRSWCR